MSLEEKNSVIPGTPEAEPGTHGPHPQRSTPSWAPDRAPRVRNDGAMFGPLAASALLLSACASYPPGQTPPDRLPTHGAIAYACANGAQLMVEYAGDEARVAILGGPSMVLPQTGEGAYSNGRYALSGSAATANWTVGRSAPVSCRGN